MTDLQQRVSRGAKLLDEKMPGWFEKIDLGKLCMSDGTVCVLGQLWGKGKPGMFGRAIADLGLNRIGGVSAAERHGFCAKDEDYPQLDQLWMAEVKARYDRGFEL